LSIIERVLEVEGKQSIEMRSRQNPSLVHGAFQNCQNLGVT